MASLSRAAGPRLIVHIVHRFAVGGLENGVVNLINRLPHERWSHAVVALTDVDATFARRIARDDVCCIGLGKPPGQGAWHYGRVYRLLRQMRPAVVHTRNIGTLEFQLPAWAARVPARVHGEHGRDADDVHGTNRRHIVLRRMCKGLVHEQIALGSELTAYLRERVGVRADALTTICNGVDDRRFSPAPQRLPIDGCPFGDEHHWLVGTVGRMQTVKAQTDLARAFVMLLRERPAWRERLRLVMIGEGPLRAECLRILEQAGCASLAWLPGERGDVADVMRGLDCFALPSHVEGISNTILEAMTSGLPVVATVAGGNRDLVAPGVTGELVAVADVSALAAGLAAMAADPQRAARMGRAGRALVESRFSLSAMVAAYEVVYERALAHARKE